jgi:hypothetical protein
MLPWDACDYVETNIRQIGDFMLVSGKSLLTLSVAAALFTGSALPVSAQQSTPAKQQKQQTMQEQTSRQGRNIEEGKIDAYVTTTVKLNEIKVQMAPEIKAAETDQKKTALYKEMQENMVRAIQNTEGITVREYNSITSMARENPQLAERIRSKFDM